MWCELLVILFLSSASDDIFEDVFFLEVMGVELGFDLARFFM